MTYPFISIVLATKNEEKNIERCLASIDGQSYPRNRIEIIVVDNNSTDKTRVIAKKYADKIFNLVDMVDLGVVKNYRGAQLNVGVKHSKGEIIFLPDADMTFDPELLKEAAALIEIDRFDALYIPETVKGKGFFGAIRNFERSFYNMTPIDGVRVVRKDVYVKVGGFDEKNIKFGPDDWDFTKEIKAQTDRVTVTTHTLYHHEEELSLASYLSKKSKYLDTFSEYKEKWGLDDPDIQKQFSLYYRFFGVFIEHGKWKKLLRNPLLTVGMYLIRSLVGIQYIATPYKNIQQTQKLIAFFNAYSHGKAGGDSVFIEITKRLPEYKKIVITSKLGKTLCLKSGLVATYLITSKESAFTNVIWIYLKRTFNAFFLRLDLHSNDILLGSSDFFPDVLPIFLLKIRNRRIKWVQHVFHFIPPTRKIPFLTQKISLFFIQFFADIVVVDNQILKKELIQFGMDPQKIVVNYPGIDLAYFQSIKKSKSGYDGIFMGQLRLSKGIFDLITIWNHVCHEYPTAKLGIIGKGNNETIQKLRYKIEEAQLEKNIDLLGFVEDEKAFLLIKNSKVFLFPSREEGFGISPLQAQALQVPVVAWKLPVFAEVFPKGMTTVEPYAIDTFASEVITLLKNRSIYQKISEEAVENATRYDWDKTAKKEALLMKELQ